MRLRIAQVSVAATIILLLSACASGGTPADGSSSGRAVIELAVSHACTAGATEECVSVNGEDIAAPSSYEGADVQDADVVDSGGQSTVHVTFTDEGGKVLNQVTTQAAQAANGARLVMKAGDAIIGAPIALAPLEGREVSIAVPQGDSAQDLRDAILGN